MRPVENLFFSDAHVASTDTYPSHMIRVSSTGRRQLGLGLRLDIQLQPAAIEVGG